ncbi:MAG: hypothetical protein ABEJ78_10290 [Haloferacaceae archaeon]
MQRRKFIAGVGALAAGGAAALGTGAFTSARASRIVSVDVTGDQQSYLGLRPNADSGAVSTGSDGTLAIDLASDSGHGGTGIPNDGVTRLWPAFELRDFLSTLLAHR